MRRIITIGLLLGMLAILYTTFGPSMLHAASAAPPAPSARPAPGDWSTYLYNNARSSFNSIETTINQTTAANLKLHWTYQDPAAGIISVQPVEANNMIYWGSWNDGIEHATTLNGTEAWGTNVGVSPPANCGTHTLGVASTATIATESIGGTSKSVLYVAGGDVNFYALNALTGAQIWKTPLGTKPDYFLWSSPAVYNGSVYIGVASRGDCPLVQGQLVQMSAATGQIQHVFNTVPNGCVGASVWGSPTIDKQAGTIYFATGNGGSCGSNEPYAVAIVEVRASDLSLVDSWQVPSSQVGIDSDFGTTPTLFQATINGTLTNMVGAVNKNGYFYALKRGALSKGPVWTATIANGGYCPQCGDGSVSPAGWDGTNLYVAGGNTTISGQSCLGSVRSLDPATGNFHWQKCFNSGPVLGAVSLVKGVAFVGQGTRIVALGTSNGVKLFDYNTGAQIYEGASISNGIVYIGSTNANLYAFGL